MKYRISHQVIEGSYINHISFIAEVNDEKEFNKFCKNYQHNMGYQDMLVLYLVSNGKPQATFLKELA